MRNFRRSLKMAAILAAGVLMVSCQKEKQLPTVSILEIDEVTFKSASVKSLITSDGGATITARGVCWSTAPSVSIEGNSNKTTDAALSGESKSTISNLTNKVVYYVRAYASNSVGTAYSEEKQFSTKSITPPQPVTISNVTATTCTAQSSVISVNYLEIQKKGIVLRSAAGTSTITDSVSKDNISLNLTALLPNTEYFAKSFITNPDGTFYGEEISFTTKNIPVLSTPLISNLTNISCKISANITSDNYMPIIQKGIIYRTETNIYGVGNSTSTTIKDESTTKTVSASLVDLYADVEYYAKAYVTTENGTYYSEEIKFATYITPYDPNNPVVLKPNIYLYPKVTSNLQVELLFPQGGNVTTSIPEYGTGWNVTAEPNGTIDKKYSYLFYESKQPNVWQYTAAWNIKKSDLKAFFIKNMTEYGFAGQEITDFVDFWVPRLTKFDNYIIYPQDTKTINTAITLKISQTPENLLRLFYVIEGATAASSTTFETPVIDKSFSRSGYFATEWGVILK